jgi:hypothetical protein
MVGSDSYRKPLLRFEQPASLCSKLTRPMAKEVNGNVYVRAATTSVPLVQMSPASTDNCLAQLGSLDEFRKLVPAFEANGRQLDHTPRWVFKGPDVDRYELLQAIPGGAPLPADIRKLLGWIENDAGSPGAYPYRH